MKFAGTFLLSLTFYFDQTTHKKSFSSLPWVRTLSDNFDNCDKVFMLSMSLLAKWKAFVTNDNHNDERNFAF